MPVGKPIRELRVDVVRNGGATSGLYATCQTNIDNAKSVTPLPRGDCRLVSLGNLGEAPVRAKCVRSAKRRSATTSSKRSFELTRHPVAHSTFICSASQFGSPWSERPSVCRRPCMLLQAATTVPEMRSSSEETRSDDSGPVLGSLFDKPGQPHACEDEWVELVRAIAGGDEAALRELFDRTHRIVFTLSVRIVKSPLFAEEVTLDVFHDVWRHAATYDATRGSVVAWIMNQTRSRAVDRVRREGRQKRTAVGIGFTEATEVREDDGSTDEARRLLVGALEALTIDERRAIETAYFDELTYVEVAQRLGAPVGTVKTRIRSGLAKLRTLLPRKEDL